jgi:hypothetical protein
VGSMSLFLNNWNIKVLSIMERIMDTKNIIIIMISSLFENINVSFEAILVIYVNKIKTPPIITKNRM